MTTNTFSDRLKDIRKIHQDYRVFYQLSGGLSLLIIGVWIGSLIFAHDDSYATNVYTELLGVLVTIILLDRLNIFRLRQQSESELGQQLIANMQQQWSENDLKRQLIMEAGSLSNEKSKDAIHHLRKYGWLVGDNGILHGQSCIWVKLAQ